MSRAFQARLGELLESRVGPAAVSAFVGRHLARGDRQRQPYAGALAAAERELRFQGLVVRDLSVESVPGEPSAEDMARALFLRVERMNALLRDFFDRCNGGGYERNPVTAPYCLVILATGAGREAPQVTGGDLAKYGCARLENAIGYACDFEFNTGLRGGLYDIPEFAPFRSFVGRTRGRFFETREGWLHEPL